jgi:hypothetical protein
MNRKFAYLVLAAAIMLILLAAGVAGYLSIAYSEQMPAAVSAYVEHLSSLFMAGAGAIFALLGVWGLSSGGKKPPTDTGSDC